MRCPQCGLVHPPSDATCRRCEIDLRTGESRARECAVTVAKPEESIAERLRSVAKRVPARKTQASPEAPARDKGKENRKKALPQPVISVGEQAPDESRKKSKVREWKLKVKDTSTLPCAQCGEPMHVARTMPFSRNWPYILVGLGTALLIAGIFIHVLLVTAVLAIAAGIAYTRVGRTYWKCEECGLTITRAG